MREILREGSPPIRLNPEAVKAADTALGLEAKDLKSSRSKMWWAGHRFGNRFKLIATNGQTKIVFKGIDGSKEICGADYRGIYYKRKERLGDSGVKKFLRKVVERELNTENALLQTSTILGMARIRINQKAHNERLKKD